jgi:beta-galactosidase
MVAIKTGPVKAKKFNSDNHSCTTTVYNINRSIGGSMGKKRWLIQSSVLVVLCAISAAIGAQQYNQPKLRTVQNINKTWKFIKQDVGVTQGSGVTDPAGMSNVNLPHSFEIPYWRVGGTTATALGWYRKHITIDQSVVDAKKRVFIEFEAAFQIANVYVNGSFVGQHKGGYTGFSYDITQWVKAGDNVVAVFLDARYTDTIAPLSGEHVFIGGIYRNVTLVITDPLHVTWYGTFVTTPQATSSSGTVKVKTEIKNYGTAAATCRVKSIVVDAAGAQVTSFESTQSVGAGATVTFVQTSDPLSSPRLWSPASPNMYKVYTEVYNGTAAVDNFESPLGFRTIKWTMTNGFELNGSRLWLQGANVHQDHAGWGDASASTGSFRDVKLVKGCGMNFIRGSHYPHAPAFSDACDKIGVCLWSEAPFWALGLSSSYGWGAGACVNNGPFKKSLLDQTREMIRIHRNHPSIIAWSMGNELWFWGSCSADTVVACLARMIAVAHAEDSTRPAGVGGVQLNTAQLSKPCDIVGFNGGLTTGDAGIPSMVSEYGSCTDGGDGYEACWGDNITTPPTPNQKMYRAGVALWCAFDHGSNINTGLMGMINNARVPQRRWYFYRNLYLGIAPPAWPAAGTAAKLKLTTDRDTITDDGTTDAQILVEVQDASGKWLSNSPDITFTDKSGLGTFPTGSAITFTGGAREKGVRNGQAAIEFRSYNAGTVTIEATSGSLPPASVNITVLHAQDYTSTVSGISTVSHLACGPEEVVLKGFGSRITLPGSLSGKKVAVSLFDMRGRLIGQVSASHGRVIVQRNAAEGIVIAKAKVVK